VITNLAQVKAAHRRFLEGHRRATHDELDRAGDEAHRHVESNAKFRDRSGKLRRSTNHSVRIGRNKSRLRLKWSPRYAGFIEYGTRAHVIRPRRKKFLRFRVGGRVVFARKVNHPGTRPYKFGWKASRAAHRVFGQRMRRRMTQLAKRF